MFNLANMYNQITFAFKNNSGSTITARTVVTMDGTPNASATDTEKQTVDPFSASRGPLEGLANVPSVLYSILSAPTVGSVGLLGAVGVSLSDIPDDEWGLVVVSGPALCKHDTASTPTHLQAFGRSDTVASQLIDVTAVAAFTAEVPHVIAYSIGTNAGAAYAANAERDVYVCTYPGGSLIGLECLLGTLT